MRCYFHLVRHVERIVDPLGVEVSNLEITDQQAMSAVMELRQDAASSNDLDGWRLTGTDGAGNVLLSIALARGVSISQRS